MAPFYGCLNAMDLLQGHSLLFTVYFLPLSVQEYLVLISSILEGWKAESTLKPPSGFEPKTPRLGIQHLNY